MTVDPAVRSIRVAVALCDRFAALIAEGPQVVRAAKQNRALVGVSGDESGLSLRIGEAQQLYPEIWRHLDDARATLGTRTGYRDNYLSGYDELRKAEGVAIGAEVATTHASHGHSEYGYQEVVKNANFNQQGLKRAREAIDALMRAMPEVDWAAVARAEADDPEARAFARSQRTKRYVRMGMLALAIASPFIYVMYTRHEEQVRRERSQAKAQAEWEARALAPPPPLPAADQARLKATVDEVLPRIRVARASWASAVAAEALARIKPGTEPCPAPFHLPDVETRLRYVDAPHLVNAREFEASAFIAVPAGTAPTDDDLARAEQQLDVVAAGLAAGTLTRGQARVSYPRYLFFLVIDREVPPTRRPGSLDGRAFVYGINEHAIVCAATIASRGRDGLELPEDGAAAREMLHRDLEMVIREQIHGNLRRIAP